MEIKKFSEYEQINEGWKENLTTLIDIISSVFNEIAGINVSWWEIERYAKTMNVANSDTKIQQVIRDFKDYVRSDYRIVNKQQVYNMIDNTPIVYRKNDQVCHKLYQMVKERSKTQSDPYCWCSTTNGGKSVIFLAKDAPYNSVFHELSHAIEPVVKVDPKILDSFNFNYTNKQTKFLFELITDNKYSIKSDITKDKNYLSDPSEVWARMNNLKMFLYKHKYLNTPTQNISELLLLKIITGEVFRSLNDKDQQEMMRNDFMQILVFINVRKYNNIYQFVQTKIKNNKNLK